MTIEKTDRDNMNGGPFDLIGDIHGHFDSLVALLEKLGYRKFGSGYRHPVRKVIYLGDFIDRGPAQREVIETVRSMMDQGDALAVMGNHEFNAIAYATRHPVTNEYLREHGGKKEAQHTAFLAEYAPGSAAYRDAIAWFRTLPLWLDLGNLRVIHACWDLNMITRAGAPWLTDELLVSASKKGIPEHEMIEILLKGKELKLPEGNSFPDAEGVKRHDIRVRWWDKGATSYREAYIGPEFARTHIPEDDIKGLHLVEYSHEAPPLFLGHYWLEGTPKPLAANIACLDYGVAKRDGKLVAYRWDGERTLSADKFVWVPRQD